MFTLPYRLRRAGVLGINQRNLDYILEHNKRQFYPRADNKIVTKQLAEEHNIAVPELYRTVETVGELRHLEEYLKPYDGFVIKPAHGSGGDGVYVVTSRAEEGFVRATGVIVTLQDLRHHLSNILHGLHSLGGQPDFAMIEYRVQFDPLFESITYRGVPDIRIITFYGVPLIAMLRLPTKQSSGRANLHQGAVGVGVELASGRTTYGVTNDSPVSYHPDTGKKLEGLQIPQWDRLLELAAGCYEFSELAYLGVDIVFDRYRGPLILEINARPGLSVQMANQIGLHHRLKAIENHLQKLQALKPPAKAHWAKQNLT